MEVFYVPAQGSTMRKLRPDRLQKMKDVCFCDNGMRHFLIVEATLKAYLEVLMSSIASPMFNPVRRANGSCPTPDGAPQQLDALTSHDAIERRAYARFLKRGSSHGQDQEDWLTAEAELEADSHRD
jgi:hypothetical protein